MAQPKPQGDAQEHTAQGAQDADGIEQPQSALGEELGLLQNEIEPGGPVLPDGIEELVPLPGEGLPGQKLAPKDLRQGQHLGGLGAVDASPEPVHQQQLVLGPGQRAQQGLQLILPEVHHQVSRRGPVGIREKGGAPQSRGLLGGRILRGVEDQVPGGLGGGVEDPPGGGQPIGAGGGPGGIAAGAADVVELEDGVAAQSVRGLEEHIVHAGILPLLSEKGTGDPGAAAQSCRRLLKALGQPVQGPLRGGELLLGGLGLGGAHPDPEHLEQQRRAQKGGHQGGQQEGGVQPLTKGTEFHGVSSDPK